MPEEEGHLNDVESQTRLTAVIDRERRQRSSTHTRHNPKTPTQRTWCHHPVVAAAHARRKAAPKDGTRHHAALGHQIGESMERAWWEWSGGGEDGKMMVRLGNSKIRQE